MTFKRRRKRAGKDGFKLFLFFGLVIVFILFALFLRLIHDLDHDHKSDSFINNVLLHLDNKYHTRRMGSVIYVSVDRSKRLQDILSEVEQVISGENGSLSGYQIKKNGSDISLQLTIHSRGAEEQTYQMIISKNDPEKDDQLFMEGGVHQGPIICIIIDDAGYNSPLTSKFIKLPVKLGIAVLPFLKNSAKIAGMIKEADKEVLLHMPMEPENYRERRIKLFESEILTGMTVKQIHETMERMLTSIPHVTGVNNHQGSRVTADKRVMKAVLDKIKKKKLYFIDSLTSKKSVTRSITGQLQVNYGIRDVFLDNRNEYSYIAGQMEKLINIALKKGKAIGIGHIGNENTYKVVKDYISIIRSKGIKMVNPSEIINKFTNKEVTDNVKENIFSFN
ncbi:MAG: divergent polysaccharide deacetylase family protein [Spirochaetes bacterium]|nr:divergent polysaccharide deacetylase family protein [Spirochaetota bacterium]